VSVCDMSGRRAEVSQWTQGGVVQLELAGLSAGMYTVSVTHNDGRATTSRLAVH